jgi:3-phosphoshikimate 1-carboxyvinyltransferase
MVAVAIFMSTYFPMQQADLINLLFHERLKKSAKTLATELRRLGVEVEEHQDGISVSSSQPQPAAVDTYEDHRVAMSFALIGLKVAGIRINNPGCVSKTFPTYFEVWQALRN